jgi:hypothetical protein
MSRIDFVTGAPERHMPLVDGLSTVPDRVASALAGTSAARARQASEGEWSATRVLAHMVSYARHNHEFIFATAWMTDAVRQPWDEAAEVEAEGWAQHEPAALVNLLRAELAPTIDLLGGTPDASWGRPGIVPGRGRRSLRQQVEGHLAHLDDHIEQLRSLVGAEAATAR